MLLAHNNSTLMLKGVSEGFFANFYIVLGALDSLEKKEYQAICIDFDSSHLYYEPSEGNNWWDYYFEMLTPSINKENLVYLETEGDLAGKAKWGLSKKRANYLINKYIKLRANIQQELDEFCSQYFHNYMIGIHYRGTDKLLSEAKLITYKELFTHMDKLIKQFPHCKFFIATDEEKFLNAAKKKYHTRIIYRNQKRSTNSIPVHRDKSINNYIKGKEALLDCLLLAKCNILIRTASNLSDVSCCLNPDIRTINYFVRIRR